MSNSLDISNKPSPFTLQNKIYRVLWSMTYTLLFKYTPNPLHKWRIFLLRLFGAKISSKARISPKASITFPKNLIMEDYATLGPYSIVYSTAQIKICKQATISQYSYLCSATHDYEDSHFTLFATPILIEDNAWVSADVFVGPGVTIAEGCVIGARSSIFKSTDKWKVYAGTPAKYIKDRVIKRDRSNEKNRI